LICFPYGGVEIPVAFCDSSLNPITYVAKTLKLSLFSLSFFSLVRIPVYTHHPNFSGHKAQKHEYPYSPLARPRVFSECHSGRQKGQDCNKNAGAERPL